jgi:superfamily II DNA or RNA helicase
MTELPDGFYERLIEGSLASDLARAFGENWRDKVQTRSLETGDADDVRHEAIITAIRQELGAALDSHGSADRIEQEIALYIGLLRQIRAGIDREPLRPLQMLTSLDRHGKPLGELPRTGLSRPWLFTSGRHDPPLLDELRRELSNVDHVDILVSFITWSGVRKIRDLVQAATAVGADGTPATRFRILTTTYIGATEPKAVQWLAEQPGIEVRISLDGRRTRLHAKAWIFRRVTGYGTAYVGSANLSGSALTGGLEWTMKTTQAAEPDLFATAIAHFETLWEDPEFTPFNPADEIQRRALKEALHRERGGGVHENSDGTAPVVFFNLRPKAYQDAILDRLAAERRHGRNRNLLVAATGTGKTVIAAFDYLATCQKVHGRPRLLFIAHRKEILDQARATFIQVLRDPGFGAICAGGKEPASFDHVFCTVQSFRTKGLAQRYGPEHWHTVIIDECHHMTAASYANLADLHPKILLGLTATPERADGVRLDDFFDMRLDGGPAAELRLWEALDQQLLAPFEYYGCEDQTDFSRVRWDRRANEIADLERILTGNHIRAQNALAAIDQYVSDPHRMRALVFCVSVNHASFMTEVFMDRGLAAEVVTGETSPEIRLQAPSKLTTGELQVICTCDLYNEGIDIPSIDTLLMLRPSHSPVLIQQQLGRGLRLAPNKESCLVIDLVGRHNTDFRFDRILGLLSGLPRTQIVEAVEKGFTTLPPGCHIHLDRLTREQVLRNLRDLSITSWRHLVREAQAWATQRADRKKSDLATFLRDTGLNLSDLYRGSSSPRGWAALRRRCGLEHRPEGRDEASIARRIPNLLDQDDPALLASLCRLGENGTEYNAISTVEQRRLDAISAELFPSPKDACSGKNLTRRLADAPALRDELAQVARILEDNNDRETNPVPDMPHEWPFHLHCAYSLRSLALLSGKISPDRRYLPREGLIRFNEQEVEFLLVTLDKSTGFSATTSYHDYAISPERFHWQTQNSAGPSTGVGQRYISGAEDGWVFQLFVRESKDRLYCALGPVHFESFEGEKPMSIIWDMEVPMPLKFFRRYSVLREG